MSHCLCYFCQNGQICFLCTAPTNLLSKAAVVVVTRWGQRCSHYCIALHLPTAVDASLFKQSCRVVKDRTHIWPMSSTGFSFARHMQHIPAIASRCCTRNSPASGGPYMGWSTQSEHLLYFMYYSFFNGSMWI